METKQERLPGTWAKVALISGPAVALVLGAFALLESLTLNHDCGSYSGCVPDDEATAILWVGVFVTAHLFGAAGCMIAALRGIYDLRVLVWVGVVLGTLGGFVWLYWLLMVFTAGIRATT